MRGLKLLANVAYTPGWARPSDCGDMMCPPANMDHYARFMGGLVRHYSRLGVKRAGVERAEPVLLVEAQAAAGRYAEMVRKAYAGQAGRPGVTIVAGALALSRDNEAGTTMNPRT